MFVFRRLFFWREQEAIERDESPSYICPSSLLLDCAEYLPIDVLELSKLQSPLPASMRPKDSNVFKKIVIENDNEKVLKQQQQQPSLIDNTFTNNLIGNRSNGNGIIGYFGAKKSVDISKEVDITAAIRDSLEAWEIHRIHLSENGEDLNEFNVGTDENVDEENGEEVFNKKTKKSNKYKKKQTAVATTSSSSDVTIIGKKDVSKEIDDIILIDYDVVQEVSPGYITLVVIGSIVAISVLQYFRQRHH